MAENTAEPQPLLLKEEEKWRGDFIVFFTGIIDILSWVALVAQSVERVLGKDEVTGSNPVSSSNLDFISSLGAFFGFMVR